MTLAFLWLGPIVAEASLSRIEQAVRKRPKDLRLRFLLGKTYASKGKLRQAARQYQAILKKKSLPTVMFQLGLTQARLGDLTGAVLNWTPILEKKPNNTRTMSYLGLALYKQGLQAPNEELRERLFQDSLAWWKRILKLNPSNLKARYFAGIEYFKLNRLEDAARQWLIFLRVKKNHPKVLSLLSKALIKMRKYDQAERALNHLSSLPIAQKGKLKIFITKAYAKIDEAKSGGSPRIGLDPDEIRRGAVGDDDGSLPPRPLPPGEEPPPPPPITARPIRPPPALEDEQDTLQAETLFLDGLEYKEKGNFEKALFAFLQAVDIQPEFSQVYLQIGEVYLGLAKLAPTPDEFKERLRLAEDSLSKVKKLSPGTLLAHAGQSKLVVVKRSQSLGFTGYHTQVAKKAAQQNRISDAFDEYVLLLSIKDFRPDTFFALAALVPKLTEANRQDLRFFLEELKNQHPGHALTSYLLGRVYLSMTSDETAVKLSAQEFETAWKGFARDDQVRDEYLTYASTPRAGLVDGYVQAKMQAERKKYQEALESVETYLQKAKDSHLFYRDAAKLKEQLALSLRPKQAGAARVDHFKEEKALIQRNARETKLFFKVTNEGIPQLSPGHLEDEARFRAVRVFVETNPDHGLGQFLLGWLLKRRASGKSPNANPKNHKLGMARMQKAHEYHLSDPAYHHAMALQCLRWSLVDPDMEVEAEQFFTTCRQILLSFGRVRDKAFAVKTLEAGREWFGHGNLERTKMLIETAKKFDSGNLQVHSLIYDLNSEEGGIFRALGGATSWLSEAFRHLWMRQVLLSDLAIILFMVVLLTMLGWSAVLLVRYHGELHFMFRKFWASKGIVLPLSLFMTVTLVIWVPTGLILFVPFLTWPVMRAKEKTIYISLAILLALVPLFLPLSMGSNYELLRIYESIQSGELETAIQALEESSAPLDPTRRYLQALISLRLGDLDSAGEDLAKLSSMDTQSDGVLLNRGVVVAKQGDYETAEKLFNQAISKNPTSAPALFNLSSLHFIRGNEDKTAQYRRWAESAGGESLPIDELTHIPEGITRLPLLDQPLPPEHMARYFDFYSSSNFFAFHAPLLAFLGWLLAGGGLCGLLLFARERMDVNFSEFHQENKELSELRTQAYNHARIVNLIFPGLGLTFVGAPVLGTLLFGMTCGAYTLWYSGGGFLSQQIFSQPDLGPIPTLLGLVLVAALGLHLLAQYLLWTRRNQVEAR